MRLAELTAVNTLDHPIILASSLLTVSLVLLGPIVDGLAELEGVRADSVHSQRVSSEGLRNGSGCGDRSSGKGDSIVHRESGHVLFHV